MDQQSVTVRDFGPAKLPGLTLFFLINLWIGVILLFLSGLGLLYFMVIDDHILYYLDGPVLVVMLFACVVLGGWYAWLAMSIHRCDPNAPARCRVLLVVGMILLGLGLLSFFFIIWREFDAYYYWTNTFLDLLPAFQNLLAAIVISEAWRRYFAVSSKVRTVFGPYHPHEGAARRVPGEIGLFQVTCWLCLIYYGLQGVAMLFFFWSAEDVSFSFAALMHHLLNAVLGIIIPIVALIALGKQQRGAVLACLGIWLGGEVLMYCLGIYEMISETGYVYRRYMMPLLTASTIIPLVFWWYFYTSEKAAAWFSPQPDRAGPRAGEAAV